MLPKTPSQLLPKAIQLRKSMTEPEKISNPVKRRITAIIATFNRGKYIAEAIDSMLAQTRPLDELIVVDDGSTDNTADVVARYGNRVRYISKANGGKSSALNLGIQVATGDWLWLFDDDDVAELRALERFLLAIAAGDNIDFAYSGQIVGSDGPDGKIVRGHTVPAPVHPPHELFVRSLSVFPFRLQGALIHRRCFEKVGNFDERYLRGQDYEFILRLLKVCRGARVDRPAFVWRVHEGPRGPAAAQHEGRLRVGVWKEFSSMLGRELRSSLALSDYLLPPLVDVTLSPMIRRRALICRMEVMASKGLLVEMLEDLRAAGQVERAEGHASLDQDERKVAWSCAVHEYFVLEFLNDPTGFAIAAAKNAVTPTGRELIMCLAKGMLWASAHADVRHLDRIWLGMVGLRLLVLAKLQLAFR